MRRVREVIGGARRALPLVLALTCAAALMVLAGAPGRRTTW